MMQQVVAQFQVIGCIVVDGAREADEEQAQQQTRSGPQQPPARQREQTIQAEHFRKDTL
jgi:hypothetical protein